MAKERTLEEVLAGMGLPQEPDYEDIGRSWYWLTSQLSQILVNEGDSLRGFSVSLKEDGWLLCVRLTSQSVPSVVYSKKATPTDCVQSLKRRFDLGNLQYFEDRYA